MDFGGQGRACFTCELFYPTLSWFSLFFFFFALPLLPANSHFLSSMSIYYLSPLFLFVWISPCLSFLSFFPPCSFLPLPMSPSCPQHTLYSACNLHCRISGPGRYPSQMSTKLPHNDHTYTTHHNITQSSTSSLDHAFYTLILRMRKCAFSTQSLAERSPHVKTDSRKPEPVLKTDIPSRPPPPFPFPLSPIWQCVMEADLT